MQNFFNFNSLLFSFFVSQTYASLYQQQAGPVRLERAPEMYGGIRLSIRESLQRVLGFALTYTFPC